MRLGDAGTALLSDFNSRKLNANTCWARLVFFAALAVNSDAEMPRVCTDGGLLMKFSPRWMRAGQGFASEWDAGAC